MFLQWFSVFSNMANPIQSGTLCGDPFVNKYVDVLHENIFIDIDENFKTANFKIEYHIDASQDGIQIPFLFYAQDYLGDFVVKIDGKQINLKEIGEEYKKFDKRKLKDFSSLFVSEKNNKPDLLDEIDTHDELGFYINSNDLIFFDTDISKGKHLIEVTYKAKRWTDRSGLMNRYYFRYALSPAKFWKSFGTLHLEINTSDLDGELSLNIENINELEKKTKLDFNEIPVDILEIKFNPKKSEKTVFLQKIGIDTITLIFFFFMLIVHLIATIYYRKKNLQKRFSLVVILGSLLIPFIVLLFWLQLRNMLFNSMGEHAGMRGYDFMIFSLYPIILPFYWLIFWIFDRVLKRKLIRKIAGILIISFTLISCDKGNLYFDKVYIPKKYELQKAEKNKCFGCGYDYPHETDSTFVFSTKNGTFYLSRSKVNQYDKVSQDLKKLKNETAKEYLENYFESQHKVILSDLNITEENTVSKRFDFEKKSILFGYFFRDEAYAKILVFDEKDIYALNFQEKGKNVKQDFKEMIEGVFENIKK